MYKSCTNKTHVIFQKIISSIFLFLVVCSSALAIPSTVCAEQYRFKQMWPGLLQPWYFYGISCIAIDGSNSVYVADSGNNRILKFTLDGQLITTWGKTGSNDGEFQIPGGIAVDLDGNVYVSEQVNNRIQKFTPNGQFLKKWGTPGTGNGEFNKPMGLTVDSNGFVCVADALNHRIQKFTGEGHPVAAWGSLGSGNAQFDTPVDIAIDNGVLLVIDSNNNRIQRLTTGGTFLTPWGSSGSGDGEFMAPEGITVDAQGNIFVADTNNHRIQKLSSDGSFLDKWGSLGLGDEEFFSPFDITVDNNGIIYILDSTDRLKKYTSAGILLAKWGSSGTADGYFYLPEGIAVDTIGSVYIADCNNYRIQKFNADGAYVTKWGSKGSGSNQFEDIAGIATDDNNNVYIADDVNHCIKVFSSDGSPIKTLGQCGISGSAPGIFNTPWGVAADHSGNIYVSECGNNRIQKFSPDGSSITWGSFGYPDTDNEANGQFWNPWSVAVDDQTPGETYVYVADGFNNRIQKFTGDGVFCGKFGTYGSNPGQFNNPYALSLDAAGNLYVAEAYNHRVQIVRSTTTFENGTYTTAWEVKATFGEQGPLPGQLNVPHGITINKTTGDIYISDKANNRIQVFKKEETLENAKAIIVAGGGDYPGNNLWTATQMCANFSYWTLAQQGFTKQDIYYLSSDRDLDLDGNGVFDDVDDDATKGALATAIAQCSASGTDNVVLYITDHGGAGVFRLNGSELLTASDLAVFLDTLENSISGKVILIYDACESGSFIPLLLSGDRRIIITSTDTGEQAKFLDSGLISFSNFFWTAVFNGSSVAEAFGRASDSMSFIFDNQHPQLSGEADNLYIGNGTAVSGDAPMISQVSTPQTIAATSTATLYAEGVSDEDGIARVWAVIWPPDYVNIATDNPVLNLPTVELLPTTGSRYEAAWSGFSMTGLYRIAVYAMDRLGNTSVPSFTSVTVNSALARKALIVAAADPADPIWPAVERNAEHACEALLLQGYEKENIKLFSPVTFSACVDFTYAPTLSNLYYYLTTWAADNTQDVVLYMLGNGSAGSFRLSSTGTLLAATLGAWLNQLQNQAGLRVTVIYDANSAGSFLPALKPPAGQERIVISSTGDNEAAYFSTNGDVSFSQFFFSQVVNGATVYNAFTYARNAISFLNQKNEVSFSCYRQTPMLDDNGNGIGNEQGDGKLARTCRIGTGIVLADDAPTIAAAGVEEAILNEETSTIIWAQAVTGTHPIVRVWAVITPPSFCGGQPGGVGGELPVVELAIYNSAQNRYEGTYDGFYATTSGTYSITVYAEDAEGNISSSKDTSVYQAAGPDIYEDDDTYLKANLIGVMYNPGQQHNFHKSPDPDWVTFYGVAGDTYTIEAGNLGSLCSPILEVYGGDGVTLLGYGWNKIEEENRVYFNWPCAAEGIYYVRAWNLTGAVGKDTEYELRVYKPEAPLLGTIAGSVSDSKTRAPLSGVMIRTNGNQTAQSQQGEYLIAHPEGTYTLSAEASGYKPYTVSVSVAEGEIVIKNISMVANTSSTTTTAGSTTSTTTGSGSTTTSPTTISTTSSSTTTTTTRPGICPVQQVVGSESSKEIRVFRQYRDQRLAKSAEGLVCSYLYYRHAPELNQIFAARPQLKTQAKAFLTEVLPAVEISLKDHAKIRLSRAQYREACDLLVKLQGSASPGLRKALGVVKQRLALINAPLCLVKTGLAD